MKRPRQKWPRIERYDGICNTPAMELMPRTWMAINDSGFGHREQVCNWDDQALVAFDELCPVGLMTWTHEKWLRRIWIKIGYVAPECRRRGVYRALWDALLVEARKLEVVQIAGGIHADNTSMLACAKALGRKPLFLTMAYELRPKRL